MTIFTSLPAGKVKKNFRVGIFGAKNLGSVGLGETEDFFLSLTFLHQIKSISDMRGGDMSVTVLDRGSITIGTLSSM